MATLSFRVEDIWHDTTLYIYETTYPAGVQVDEFGAIVDWTDRATDWIDPPPTGSLLATVVIDFDEIDDPAGGGEQDVTVTIPDDVRTVVLSTQEMNDRVAPGAGVISTIDIRAYSSPTSFLSWEVGGTTYLGDFSQATINQDSGLPDTYMLWLTTSDATYLNALDFVSPSSSNWEIAGDDYPLGQDKNGAPYTCSQVFIHLMADVEDDTPTNQTLTIAPEALPHRISVRDTGGDKALAKKIQDNFDAIERQLLAIGIEEE